jgi:hypothetical protein
MNILVVFVGFVAVVCACLAIWSCGHTDLELSLPDHSLCEWPEEPDGD